MPEGTISRRHLSSCLCPPQAQGQTARPGVKQTRKDNQWYFGTKAHIGVDAVTALTHTVAATSANVADITMADHLVRDDDNHAHADEGYIGMDKRLGEKKVAEDSRCCNAARRGGIKRIEESPMKERLLKIDRTKTSIRAKVEQPFYTVKNLFGYRKVRYKGLAKNQEQLFRLLGLANRVLATRCEGLVPRDQCILNLPLPAGLFSWQEK